MYDDLKWGKPVITYTVTSIGDQKQLDDWRLKKQQDQKDWHNGTGNAGSRRAQVREKALSVFCTNMPETVGIVVGETCDKYAQRKSGSSFWSKIKKQVFKFLSKITKLVTKNKSPFTVITYNKSKRL